jgi:diguanylate cyclase (GGDEF)-like protein
MKLSSTQCRKSVVPLIIGLVLCVSLPISLSASAQQSEVSTLNLCVDPDWMPFEGVIDGVHTGIASDYLSLFSELTPYSFNILLTKSWKETTDRLKAGDCDLTLMLNSSAEREKYLSFTLPYFFGPNVLVSNKDIPFMQDVSAIGDRSLGVVSGYRLLDEIPLYYPSANIQVVPSEEAGLIAVEQGDIDVYVGSLYSISLRIQQLELKSLKINGWISIQDKLRIGFTKPNKALVPIFNQAIDKITTAQHNETLNRWSNVQVIKQTDYTLFYYLLAGASLIILMLLWRYVVSAKLMSVLSHKNKQLEQVKHALTSANKNLEYLSFHDDLTSLYNRHYFMSALKTQFARLSREQCNSVILMIDLDFFKRINDQHGHMTGDKVLKQFATVLMTVLRAGDTAARWGGEEFIVLLPEANKDQSLSLASRLVKAIEQYSFAADIQLTVSIGMSQHKVGDSIESWIERADTALYQAKDEGRNCIKELA